MMIWLLCGILFFLWGAALGLRLVRCPARLLRQPLINDAAVLLFLSLYAAFTTAPALTTLIEMPLAARTAVTPALLMGHTVLAAFAFYWLLLKKRWHALGAPRTLGTYVILFAGMLALTFWAFSGLVEAVTAAGATDVVSGFLKRLVRAEAGKLFAGAVLFYLGGTCLLSMHWRLSITPVPASLKGQPICLISSLLLAMGLLGLSGLY